MQTSLLLRQPIDRQWKLQSCYLWIFTIKARGFHKRLLWNRPKMFTMSKFTSNAYWLFREKCLAVPTLLVIFAQHVQKSVATDSDVKGPQFVSCGQPVVLVYIPNLIIWLRFFYPYWGFPTLTEVFLPWLRFFYPDWGFSTLTEVFLPLLRFTYPDWGFPTLTEVFLPWLRFL